MTSILGFFEVAVGLVATVGVRLVVALLVLVLLAMPVVIAFQAVRGCEVLRDRLLATRTPAGRA